MKFRYSALVFCLFAAACTDDAGTPAPPRDFGMPDVGHDLDTPDLPVEDDVPQTPPEVNVDVEVLEWVRVEIGQKVTKSIFITNLGTQDLVITDVKLDELDRLGPSEFKRGDKWVDNGITLVPGNTFVELQVVYEPTDEEADRGTVTIETNDADEPLVEVRLQTVNAYPDLESPRLLRFGSVDVGQTETQRVYMYNRGAVPLMIESIVKTGLGPFEVVFIPTEPLPRFLQPNEQYAFDVTYSPNDDQVHRATLEITSTDPNDSPLEIALLGNSPTACIRVTPSGADFGVVDVGTTKAMDLTIFNCSADLPLQVTNVELSDDAGGVFGLNPVITPIDLSGFQTSKVTVTTGGSALEALGELKIESNDADSPLYVPLRVRPQ